MAIFEKSQYLNKCDSMQPKCHQNSIFQKCFVIHLLPLVCKLDSLHNRKYLFECYETVQLTNGRLNQLKNALKSRILVPLLLKFFSANWWKKKAVVFSSFRKTSKWPFHQKLKTDLSVAVSYTSKQYRLLNCMYCLPCLLHQYC